MNDLMSINETTIEAGLSKKLQYHIDDHVSSGCFEVSNSLGIVEMPEGYTLMLNPDRSHFYWLRFDGIESAEGWDKWACYRGATANKKEAEKQ